jgi:predicted RecA/RadA family phage recombinase
MATLATDKQRPYELGDLNSLPMVATDIIYEGAAVGIAATSGNARPLNAGDAFAGFCIQNADNATGSAGDVRVQVKTHGEVQLPVTNVAATDIGKPVYASDDDTFVLTATGNSYIGKVKRFVSTGVAVVAFDVRQRGIIDADVNAVLAKNFADLALLTDNTTGTADGTLEAMDNLATNNGNTYSDADVNAVLAKIRNNFADLAAKVNAIAALLK